MMVDGWLVGCRQWVSKCRPPPSIHQRVRMRMRMRLRPCERTRHQSTLCLSIVPSGARCRRTSRRWWWGLYASGITGITSHECLPPVSLGAYESFPRSGCRPTPTTPPTSPPLLHVSQCQVPEALAPSRSLVPPNPPRALYRGSRDHDQVPCVRWQAVLILHPISYHTTTDSRSQHGR